MRRLWLTAVCLSLGAMLAIGAAPRAGAELSEQDRSHRRALRAGRRRQPARAAGRHQDAGADEAAGRDRQPARRRRQPRRRPGREIAARRLHPADALERDGERLVALRQAAVRSGEGLRAGDHGDLDAVRDRRLAEKSGARISRSWSRSPRKSPARYNYGSSGPGSSLHLFAEMFSNIAGIKLVHIPYRGDAPMITALIVERHPARASCRRPTASRNVQSNLIRGLGVTGTKRHGGDPRRADRAGAGLQGPGGRKLGVAVRARRHAARCGEDHPGVCRQGAGRSAGARRGSFRPRRSRSATRPPSSTPSTRRTSIATPR